MEASGGAEEQSLDGLRLPRYAVMETLGRWVTRYPEGSWTDLLALRATRNRWRAAELVEHVQQEAVRDADVDATDLAYLGWLLAADAAGPEQQHTAYLLFRRAMQHRSQPAVPQRVWNTWLQLAYLTGHLDETTDAAEDRVHPHTSWAVHTDAANPYLHPGQAESAWLDRFAQPFVAGGAAPLLLQDRAGAPFDRLITAPTPDRDGPLVSVVMPVFNPDHSVHTAVASVLAQTWRNLELIVVDDASTAGVEHLEALPELDPRVRMVWSERNAGAYAARNRGLSVASGLLVTFQDADDYSHAQRVQQQAEAILADDAVVASVSRSVRATDRLAVTNVGFRMIAANLSSMMIRREQVLRRLGGFDAVRRGADTEFRDRLRQTFGTAAVHRIEHPLAVVQLTPGSLSRGEMGSIRRHPAREAYIAAAHGWHAATARAQVDPHVQPPARAPFPAPAHVSGSGLPTASIVADVLLLAPVEAGAVSDIGPLARALVDAGHRVAVKEFVGPGATLHRLRGVGPVLERLLAEGRVRWALPGDGVSTRLAIVHDPYAVLTMPEHVLRTVRAEHHLVVAQATPTGPLVHAVEGRLSRAGARSASWLPGTDTARAAVVAAGAWALPPATWHVAAAPARPRRGVQEAVVGFLSPRLLPEHLHNGDLPLPHTGRASIWAFGPYPSRAQGLPVTRIRADRQIWPQFLSQLSVFLAPGDGITTAVLDCWAAGVLVVARARARAELGSGALYLGPGEHPDLDTLLKHLADHPSTGPAAVAAGAASGTATTPSAVQATLATIIRTLEAG